MFFNPTPPSFFSTLFIKTRQYAMTGALYCHEIVHANAAMLLPSSHCMLAITGCEPISYHPLSIYPTVPRVIMRIQRRRDTLAVPQLIYFLSELLARDYMNERSAKDWNYQSFLCRFFSRRL